LLELLKTVKKKYDFLEILKQLNNFVCTKEFKESKLLIFKELLLKRLEEFSEKKELTDKVSIPFIFLILKKAFFKAQNPNGGNVARKRAINTNNSNYNSNNTNNSNSSRNANIEKKESNKIDFETLQKKNTELMTKFFLVSFSFLRIDIPEDICLSALNFIFKYLEETFSITINNKTISVINSIKFVR
jgi:hypothetical protein